MHLVGIKLADYQTGESMQEPCATCCLAKPPVCEGYNALCTKYEYDVHVAVTMCLGKNGKRVPRQLCLL